MTLAGTLLLTVYLLLALWYACSNKLVKCGMINGKPEFPMISDVIRHKFVDRIWCILSTFFSLSVLQVNLRAMYAKLYPYASKAENDSLLFVGLVTCIAFPMIGYFDMKTYKMIHAGCAAVFFLGTLVYANMYANRFNKYREHFPENLNNIDTMLLTVKWMKIVFLIFVISLPTHAAIPIWEWILGLLYINFFAISAFDNEYYETVEPVEKRD